MKPSLPTISLLFLAIALAGTLKVAGTLGYYLLFTENFIETLCENKDRPELHCDGKCVLSQMMSQEDREKSNGINLDFLKIPTVFFLHAPVQVELRPVFIPRHSYPAYSNHYHFRLMDRILHPPRI